MNRIRLRVTQNYIGWPYSIERPSINAPFALSTGRLAPVWGISGLPTMNLIKLAALSKLRYSFRQASPLRHIYSTASKSRICIHLGEPQPPFSLAEQYLPNRPREELGRASTHHPPRCSANDAHDHEPTFSPCRYQHGRPTSKASFIPPISPATSTPLGSAVRRGD